MYFASWSCRQRTNNLIRSSARILASGCDASTSRSSTPRDKIVPPARPVFPRLGPRFLASQFLLEPLDLIVALSRSQQGIHQERPSRGINAP
jgi:hypothetical protein